MGVSIVLSLILTAGENIPEQTDSINDGTNSWTTGYTYTDFNAVSTRTDARGVVTSYSYDSLHRLTQVSYNTVSGVTSAPIVTYNYDYDATYSITAQGQLVSVVVGTGSADYAEYHTVDSYKRPASTIRTMYTPSMHTYTTSYSLNQAGQMTQLTHPSGLAIAVAHDSTGRMNGLQNTSTQVNYLSSITHNIAGQVTGDTLGNGVTEQYAYDAARMQMTSQKAGTSSPYTNRMDLTYSYSASSGQMGVGSTAGNADQLMAINNNSTINGTTESAAYTYDNYGRLVTSNQTSNGSSAQRRFAYDRWGNRTGVWDATGGGNQIQSISLQQTNNIPSNRISSVTTTGTVNYSYDAAGNVTNDGVHSYTYDSEKRLVNVDSGATATYAYDDQNRRYKKTVGSTVTHYVWEGGQVLAEHNGSSGAVITGYVYSGSRMIAKISSGTTQYFLSDRLSERLALDTSGNVLGRQAHLPYGEDFGESGTQEKHHFTTYERDTESGSDYAVNRHESSGIGRFFQVDALPGSTANPQSLNRFVYAGDDPVNRTDPLGRGWVLKFICSGGDGCRFVWVVDPGSLTPTTPIPPIVLPSIPSIPSTNPATGAGPAPKKDRLSKKRLEKFGAFLESDKNKKCKEKLSSIASSRGSVFDQLESGAGSVDFYDVSSIASDDSKKWFPQVSFSGTVGDLFSPGGLGIEGTSLGAQTNSPFQVGNGPAGVYTNGGVDGALFSGDSGLLNLEHELSHYFGTSDVGMVSLFHIPPLKDPKTGRELTDSELVDVWFQAGCP